jgi:uncharacterized protein (DUF58 family)
MLAGYYLYSLFRHHKKRIFKIMRSIKKSPAFLKPEQLVPIRNLSLRARLIVEGTIAGLHQSPYHGFSSEFLEYRPYFPGESTRRIDWRKYAKSDRTVVRLFEDETNLYASLLLDKSASMDFASAGGMTKYDYARTLAASLSWILIRQRDAVGLCAFDEQESLFISPRSTNVQLKTILSRLDGLKPSGATRCGAALSRLASTIGKRGLCIVISDLLDDPDGIIRGLRHLRFKKQDVIVLRISDPMERHFSNSASLRLRDMETNEEILLDAAVAARFFRSGFGEHRASIERACRDMRIDYEDITTTEPFQKALLRVIDKRRRMY